MKKVRLKLKKKNCLIAIGILVFIIIEIINPSRIIAINKLQNKGYSKNASKEIIRQGLKKKVLDMDFNEFLELNINDSSFNKDNIDIYCNINNKKKVNLELVNKLIDKKYNAEEISLIIKSGDDSSINSFANNPKYENISNYLKYDYAKLMNLDRYINYKNTNGVSYEEAVTYVNIGLDKEFYSDYKEINEFSMTMFVNKYNKLSSDFIPNNLVKFEKEYCSGECPMDNEEVVNAFYEMAKAIREENLTIYVNSGYRSYQDQEKLYKEYTKLYGENYDVAHAGFSEHQTGLTVDIGVKGGTFKGSKEETWLKSNSYKYGFILRYDSNKVKITGYNEPWHFRYVGKDIANDIYEKGITFDEYYVKYIER